MGPVIQETTGGDIFRIEPVTPYPTDHSTLVSLASQEQSSNARPAIQDGVDMDDYDVIFVGYPIWWGVLPMTHSRPGSQRQNAGRPDDFPEQHPGCPPGDRQLGERVGAELI